MDPGTGPGAAAAELTTAAAATPRRFNHRFYPLLRGRERIEGRTIAVAEVADWIGVDREVLAYWASGRSRSTSDRLLSGLCAYFGATPDDLLVAVPAREAPPASGRSAAAPSADRFDFRGESRRVAWRRAFYEVLWQRQADWHRPIPVPEVARAAGVSPSTLLAWAGGRTQETSDRLLAGVCTYLDCRPGALLIPAEALDAPLRGGGLLRRLASLVWTGMGYVVPAGQLAAVVADGALQETLAALPAEELVWLVRSRAEATRLGGDPPRRVRAGGAALALGPDSGGRQLVIRDARRLPAPALQALAAWLAVDPELLGRVLEWEGPANA